jgi:hypothetical protein
MYEATAERFGADRGLLMALCEYREPEGIGREYTCATYWAESLSPGVGIDGTLTKALGERRAQEVFERAREINVESHPIAAEIPKERLAIRRGHSVSASWA